ncbi:MAG: peptidoglycan DD-metalloendopeptidase family protein, partial [Oscillospiraceae bacterium]|nr:peptidoglycan DD-metalloendopeptidase family protein [Oscillospiraceae bacterium]
SAEFARDKNAFAGGSPTKGRSTAKKTKQKKPGSHQPRDADVTSGHDVQKSENKTDSNDVQDNHSSFQSDTKKTAGQKAKSGQKKRRQQGQFQKENSFTENKEKPDSDNTGSKAHDGFSKEQNAFTEEGGGEQTEETKDFKDDYRRRDTYHQSEKKGRYRRREHQDRERTKKNDSRRDFQTKDSAFTESSTFAGDGEPEFQGSKRSDRLQRKAERAGKKTEAARKKLPKKKEYSLERVFDEKTGRAKYVLTAVEKEKPFKEDNPLKRMAGRAGSEFTNYAHGKVAESEKENSAVEGAHKTEQKAEDAYRFANRHYKNKDQRQREKMAKLEKKQFQKEVNFRYQKFLEENPEMQEKTLKKQLQKRLQKQRIKREYAKARRVGQAAKDTKEAAVKSANFTTKVAKKLQEAAAKHASLLVTVGASALLLIMIMTSISSCGAMFSEGISTTLAGSYMSVPAEIDAADLAFSQLEMELQKEIDSIETDYPDYDEYRYNLDAIGHDPFALISYLSAVHTEFTAADVQGEIESLFDEMYELTINPTEETRTRTVTKTGTRTVTDPVTGEETEEEYEYEEEEEYTVTILEVTLTVTDLNVVVAGHMDSEQKEIYALYNETHGLTQQFYTPLNLYWYNYVSSYYGYRINPATGAEQLHRGVDIAVPTGTTVLAAMDGTVTTAAYDSYYGNYIVIEDSNGYCTKYAHMDTLSVSAGQTVKHGDTIGTTGNTGSSTGSHLHIECLYNGEYYNPLFYFEAGEGTLYGEANAPGSGGGNAIPPDSYDDATVQALLEEAAKYLGYPYVWGGSSPSTSFDCSGFVCWVFTNSGVHNLPRTTAQGIYDQCTPVSAADAKAGDIIFFTGTYNSAGAVSHVGIYCGNGVMIHCGDPIKYASINTSYWQSHFYAFGRLN